MAGRLEALLSDWTADDVLALIEERIDEGQRLEYKRELNLDDRKQSREAAKDNSGLANAQGGLLIYGVEEEELDDGRRVPTAASPLTDGAVQARLEDVLDSAVSPKLNMETRLLETDGGYFLVVRVHQRTGPPHMVDSYNENRYYVRVGLKTRPMEQHEVDQAFRLASANEGRAHRRLLHLPLAPSLQNVEVAAAEQRVPGPWVSVVTLPLDAPDPLLEMRSADSGDYPDDGDHDRWSRHSALRGGYSWDAHGYVSEHFYDEGLSNRLRLYRNGVFELGWGCQTPDHYVPPITIAQYVHDVVGYFASSYRQAGYYGRIRLWVAMDDAEGTELSLPQGSIRPNPTTLTVSHFEWRTDENVERLLHDLDAVSHTAMDHLWVAYGFPNCWLFDKDGNFDPPHQ
jgi:hypothetical protein